MTFMNGAKNDVFVLLKKRLYKVAWNFDSSKAYSICQLIQIHCIHIYKASTSIYILTAK